MQLTVSREIIDSYSYGCYGVDVMVNVETLGYVVLVPFRFTTHYSVENVVSKLRNMRG